MNDTPPYQFEPEETLQDEDDSDCFEKSEIVEESTGRTGNTNWWLCELCALLAQVTSEHLTFSFPPSNLASGAAVMASLQ